MKYNPFKRIPWDIGDYVFAYKKQICGRVAGFVLLGGTPCLAVSVRYGHLGFSRYRVGGKEIYDKDFNMLYRIPIGSVLEIVLPRKAHLATKKHFEKALKD